MICNFILRQRWVCVCVCLCVCVRARARAHMRNACLCLCVCARAFAMSPRICLPVLTCFATCGLPDITPRPHALYCQYLTYFTTHHFTYFTTGHHAIGSHSIGAGFLKSNFTLLLMLYLLYLLTGSQSQCHIDLARPVS